MYKKRLDNNNTFSNEYVYIFEKRCLHFLVAGLELLAINRFLKDVYIFPM
jgi:hypothetical protein